MNNILVNNITQIIITFGATLIATIPSVIALVFTARQVKESTKQTKQLELSIKSGIYNDVVSTERQIWQAIFSNDTEHLRWWLVNVVKVESAKAAEDSFCKMYLYVLYQLGFYENM